MSFEPTIAWIDNKKQEIDQDVINATATLASWQELKDTGIDIRIAESQAWLDQCLALQTDIVSARALLDGAFDKAPDTEPN